MTEKRTHSEKRSLLNCTLHAGLDFAVDHDRIIALIVGDLKWFRNVIAIVNDLSLGIGEAVCNEVNGLHGADREGQVILGDFVRVQRLHLWLICHAVGQLTDTGKDTGAVGLVLAILLAHAELDCEPVDGS